MSAAGRGPRLGGVDDFYETPAWCVHRLLEVWKPRLGLLVEPCVGNGAIVRAASESLPDQTWLTYDIREESCAEHVGNFLQLVQVRPEVSGVITNPPYSLAQEFVTKCRQLYPAADIAMLLRLPFLESESRVPFFEQEGQPDIYLLPQRPSFRNGKTDATAYAWLVWPTIARESSVCRRLALTPKTTRRIRLMKPNRMEARNDSAQAL